MIIGVGVRAAFVTAAAVAVVDINDQSNKEHRYVVFHEL